MLINSSSNIINLCIVIRLYNLQMEGVLFMAGRSGGGHAGGGHAGGGSSSVSSGHSGGGHSSSSGGHAGGGRSSSSESSSGGFFSSESSKSVSKPARRESSGGGGFFSNDRPPRPEKSTTVINNTYYVDSDDTRVNNTNNGGSSGKGCGTGCLILIAIIFVIGLIGAIVDGPDDEEETSANVNATSIVREALPAGSVNETEYYTDEIGWISDEETLEKGMKNFYEKTGVQPYLYITDEDAYGESVTDPEELADYSEELYQNLFTDEGHFLLVFFSSYDVDYVDYYICGYDAEEVMDCEAADVLLDYLDDNFYEMDNGLTHEEYFSNAFDKTSAEIMPVKEVAAAKAVKESSESKTAKETSAEKSSKDDSIVITSPLAGFIIIIFLVGIFFLLSKHFKKKKKKAAQDMEILQTPLEKFGDMELEALEKKYEEQ